MAPATPTHRRTYAETQLTPSTRGNIFGRRIEGATYEAIGTELNVPATTVRHSFIRSSLRNTHYRKKGSGRRKLISGRTEKLLLRIVRIHPKWTYARVIRELGVPVSHDTIYRVLKKNGITKWKAKKRPLLTEAAAAARLAWCQARRDWGLREWSKVIWSDECSVELGSGSKREWVFRTPSQKWDKEMIQPYNKGKAPSIMVWGAFWWKHKADLVWMTRNKASKRGGYTAESYIGVLEDQIPSLYQDGMLFMQDNAPIHKARSVIAWFRDHGVNLLVWPPYSPDLNPIEHFWRKLKEIAFELNPDLKESTLTPEEKLNELYAILERS